MDKGGREEQEREKESKEQEGEGGRRQRREGKGQQKRERKRERDGGERGVRQKDGGEEREEKRNAGENGRWRRREGWEQSSVGGKEEQRRHGGARERGQGGVGCNGAPSPPPSPPTHLHCAHWCCAAAPSHRRESCSPSPTPPRGIPGLREGGVLWDGGSGGGGKRQREMNYSIEEGTDREAL